MSETYRSKLENPETDSLFDAILSLKTYEECYRFFEDLCTIPEVKSISQRWMVARLLNEGKTYQDIANDLAASTATISRVNRSLQFGKDGYAVVFERLKKESEKE